MRWIRSVFVFKGTDLGRSPSGVRCLVSLRLAGTLSGPLNSVFGIRFSRCPASLRRGCRVKRRGCILRAPPGPRKPLSAPPHFLHKRARRGVPRRPSARGRRGGPVSRRGTARPSSLFICAPLPHASDLYKRWTQGDGKTWREARDGGAGHRHPRRRRRARTKNPAARNARRGLNAWRRK